MATNLRANKILLGCGIVTIIIALSCIVLAADALQAYSAAPQHEYVITIGGASAGVLVEGCKVAWGYVLGDGVTVAANDSGGGRVC